MARPCRDYGTHKDLTIPNPFDSSPSGSEWGKKELSWLNVQIESNNSIESLLPVIPSGRRQLQQDLNMRFGLDRLDITTSEHDTASFYDALIRIGDTSLEDENRELREQLLSSSPPRPVCRGTRQHDRPLSPASPSAQHQEISSRSTLR